MKKLIASVLTLVCILTLARCGKSDSGDYPATIMVNGTNYYSTDHAVPVVKLLDDTEDDADTSGANSVGGAAPDGVSGTGTKNKNQTDAEKRAMVKNLFHPKKEG